MNLIIQKLDLPCDLKMEIHNYCYNEIGYTVDDMKQIEIEKQKPRNKFSKRRLKLELSEWYMYNVAVCWLRPAGRGVYGKKNPSSVYGGGTLYESKLLREEDLDPNYVNKKISKGDFRRKSKYLDPDYGVWIVNYEFPDNEI